MPLLQINTGAFGPELHRSRRAPGPVLERALRTPGPVIVMVHGFKFAPGHRTGCPHRHILSLRPARPCWKAMSWPRALGFGAGLADEGVAIGFGWPARGTIWQAHDRARLAGAQLAELIGRIRHADPDRPVHLVAHSLGARVVLTALTRLLPGDVGRVILLNAAAYGADAHAAIGAQAGRAAEILNITTRENDLFDFLFERLVAPPERGDRMLAHAMPARINTLTIQIDHPGTLAVLDRAGFAVAPATSRVCHWSAYLRPGLFDFYRALLRRPETLPIAQLRAAVPDAPDPRWSRVLQMPVRLRPVPPGQRTMP